MKAKKFLLFALPLLVAVTSLTGCEQSSKNNNSKPIYKGIEGWDPVLEYTGDIDVLMYIYGQPGTWKDIGNPKWSAADIIDGSAALFFAAAREFKKIYPNIHINLISGDSPNSEPSYYDYYRQYVSGHDNRPPHIMHHVDPVPALLEEGTIADYSQYKEKFPLFDYINKDLLKYTNYGGFQAAVPFGVYPQGIILNRTEIESSYLSLPEPDPEKWTIDALDEIISSTPTNTNNKAGAINIDFAMTNFVVSSIYDNYVKGRNVELNTPEVRRMLELEHKWAQDYVWFDENGKHSKNTDVWNHWEKNALMAQDAALVQLDRPYSIGGLSQLADKDGTTSHFDMYPYPSYDKYGKLSLGVMFGALHIGNQCPLDNAGKPTCTVKQKQSQEAAAYFATFMVADPRSMYAAANIDWARNSESSENGGGLGGATKGFTVLSKTDENGNPYKLPSSRDGVEDEYQQQMSYFFDNYTAFDAEKPGMSKVLDMYNSGDFIVCNENMYPWIIPTSAGGTTNIFANWNSRFKTDALGGITVSQVTWVNTLSNYLASWQNDINAKNEDAWNFLEENMRAWYDLPANFDVRAKLL